jgi:hypothetical protein
LSFNLELQLDMDKYEYKDIITNTNEDYVKSFNDEKTDDTKTDDQTKKNILNININI